MSILNAVTNHNKQLKYLTFVNLSNAYSHAQFYLNSYYNKKIISQYVLNYFARALFTDPLRAHELCQSSSFLFI